MVMHDRVLGAGVVADLTYPSDTSLVKAILWCCKVSKSTDSRIANCPAVACAQRKTMRAVKLKAQVMVRVVDCTTFCHALDDVEGPVVRLARPSNGCCSETGLNNE